MVFDIRTQALVNLALQVLLIIILSAAVFLAKKRNLGKHCMIVRAAVIVQIIAIALIMLPSLLGYVENIKPNLFLAEMLAHHTIGLLLILVWIYINLVFTGRMRSSINLKTVMRLALMLWIISLILGIHMYTKIYL
ncbi:MAG: hypothetical protein O8C66_00125 [Candidatus Methanoperedens sp.]|nr:hypothetical protein [Candidatus Methanoperedens sp.]MCZ7368896.1 hypothetical protein [Candidatus Methanoperedens sp.]